MCVPNEYGETDNIRLSEILETIQKSKCKNKIVILDSCFSGGMGDNPFDGMNAVLSKGLTILSATRPEETALEIAGHGVFTTLLCSALNGGAADLLGHITPGSIYAYIDKALGNWNQRPIFKTNVQEFVSLREANSPIDLKDLIAIKEVFSSSDTINLDPSFEFTNNPLEKHSYIKPFADNENVKTMKLLQRLERVGLVEPVDEEHMYYAVMHSKSCRLTPLGKYYKSLSINNRF
ncbi:caspase family protein [uncultured Treponema sp.]|uniref:caspase family protein n=1 Tax=uncultured Treponema sp. TaxID=162155 RepID=UPI0025870F4C|nr:caspase family protein [uncultured Treponema sp.]